MLIYSNLTPSDLDNIAQGIGVTMYNVTDEGVRERGKYAGRHAVRLTLRPGTDESLRAIAPYTGRRKWAVSWEGHRAFMVALFDRDPDAVLVSALATYNGREHFERTHGATRGGF